MFCKCAASRDFYRGLVINPCVVLEPTPLSQYSPPSRQWTRSSTSAASRPHALPYSPRIAPSLNILTTLPQKAYNASAKRTKNCLRRVRWTQPRYLQHMVLSVYDSSVTLSADLDLGPKPRKRSNASQERDTEATVQGMEGVAGQKGTFRILEDKKS